MASAVRLIHWKQVEARELAGVISNGDCTVDYSPFGPRAIRELSNNPPAAVVIDLSRLPSQGRDAAANLLQYKSLANVPFIFVDGDSEKLTKIKRLFPDLVYTERVGLVTALRESIANPPARKPRSISAFEAYKNVPLAKKLGIAKGKSTCPVGAPDDFERTLGRIPAGANGYAGKSSPLRLVDLVLEESGRTRTELPR